MDIWKLLTGVVLFLMGTGFMEEALRHALSRKFKLFLKQQTSNRFKSVAGGAVLTVFMQSSSVVNMLVLSLVGAGVVQLYQALAVMMGANIGTTFTGWLLVSLGFYFDIKDFALPLLAISGILMVAISRNHPIYYVARFFVGFAFLFLGLVYIKEGVEVLIQNTALVKFAAYPLVFFGLLGLVLTALVQSSSVVMALVLSVLYHKGIDITSGAALMLGAEIGTTFKLGLASIGGLAAKKRVAYGNMIFNSFSSILTFFFISPLLHFINLIPGFHDPLMQLVCFQTMVNVMGVILFLPVLKPFSFFLEKRFQQGSSTDYLKKIPASNISLAIDALEKEYYHLLAHTLHFLRSVFHIKGSASALTIYPAYDKFKNGLSYEDVKSLYGEIHGFYIRIRQEEMTSEEALRLESILSGMRNLMYAAKSMKDIMKDLDQLSRSSNDDKYHFYLELQQQAIHFYEASINVLNHNDRKAMFDLLVKLHAYIQSLYHSGVKMLYEGSGASHVNATELATLVNVHREMMTGFKSVIFSIKEYFLKGKEAAYFDELPGFIR
ncbi:MAG: Na/Pi cotransporter family protein [Bacteroidota bacterium]|jgi:phosphate:Na+ symporter